MSAQHESGARTTMSPRRERWLLIIGVLVALTVAREGCGPVRPLFAFNVFRFGSSFHLIPADKGLRVGKQCPQPAGWESWKARQSTVSSEPRSKSFECVLDCRGSGAFCDGLHAELGCRESQFRTLGAVDVIVEHDDPFCYTPLVKWGRGDFDVELRYQSEYRFKSCPRLRGYVNQWSVGLESCHSFKQRMGRQAAREIERELASMAKIVGR